MKLKTLSAQQLHITISISETQQGNVSLFSFSASVYLLSHLHTTPPHTWSEMDGDRMIARRLYVGQTMQKHTAVLGSAFAIVVEVN